MRLEHLGGVLEAVDLDKEFFHSVAFREVPQQAARRGDDGLVAKVVVRRAHERLDAPGVAHLHRRRPVTRQPSSLRVDEAMNRVQDALINDIPTGSQTRRGICPGQV